MFLRSTLAAALVVLTLAKEPNISNALSYGNSACDVLTQKHPEHVLSPGSGNYAFEAQTQPWSLSNVASPSCVFTPQNADQLACAIQIFTDTKTEFAVRAGGHMPVQHANSIDAPGVLVALSNMTHLHLCNDTGILEVGPGNRWQDVYEYLEPSGRITVGGRDGKIGVGGFLLGGGISYYTGEHGLASKNVVGYECVLANGTIATVTPDNSYSDLFQALQTGGGNSFCLVTRFHLLTYPSSQVFIGTASYIPAFTTQFLDASASFAKQPVYDNKASLTSIIATTPSTNETTYLAVQFYDADEDVPALWQNFTTPYMAATFSDYRRQTLASYLRNSNAVVPSTQLRQVWRTFSIKVNRVGLGLVNEGLLGMTAEDLTQYPDVSAGIVISRVTEDQVSWRKGTQLGEPIWIVVLQLSCKTEEEYAVLQKFADKFVKAVEKRLKQDDLLVEYKYLNYAGEGQKVFESLGQDKLATLRAVREKYDPSMVFTELMPGGWKVGG